MKRNENNKKRKNRYQLKARKQQARALISLSFAATCASRRTVCGGGNFV